MRLRQSVISVFRPLDDAGHFLNIPALDIIFRQPFHNLGLAYSFNFSKSYYAQFTTANLSIENIDNNIVDAFYFDTVNLKKRPLVEIRAGYSDVKLKNLTKLLTLKQSLPLIYSGTPYYNQDNKTIGGRIFNIQLSDFQSFTRVGRVVKKYSKGRLITEIIDDLLVSIKTRFSIQALIEDSEFRSLKLENNLMYNHRHVLSDILLELAKQYGFIFFVNSSGTYEFRVVSKSTSGIATDINSRNGLIEHPVGINFVQWTIKTLFGLPSILYPGDRVKIESEHFRRIALPPPNKNVDNILDGLIVDANYNWNDSSAEIQYTVAADGQPVNVNIVKAI